MSLYQELQNCKSEEDVKDCYIKALKLKDYHKGLVDIKTKEVWFETKQKGVVSTFFQFAQLFYYVQKALDKGDSLPQFLCVADQAKAAIMRTADAIPFLAQKTIKWGASGSKPTPEAVAAVSACISPYIICFNIATHEKEFIDKIKVAIKTGDIIRRDITPTNVKSVYDEWCQLIGQEIDGY